MFYYINSSMFACDLIYFIERTVDAVLKSLFEVSTNIHIFLNYNTLLRKLVVNLDFEESQIKRIR